MDLEKIANNLTVLSTDNYLVWFSYRTPIAYSDRAGSFVVRANEWGPTTGKHLNAVDGGDKANRVDGSTFLAGLATVTG